MDELKDIYGIEMNLQEKSMLDYRILVEEMKRTAEALELTTYKDSRIENLKRQKAVDFMSQLIYDNLKANENTGETE